MEQACSLLGDSIQNMVSVATLMIESPDVDASKSMACATPIPTKLLLKSESGEKHNCGETMRCRLDCKHASSVLNKGSCTTQDRVQDTPGTKPAVGFLSADLNHSATVAKSIKPTV